MTAIEELIRQKLNIALEEEKRRIANGLFEVTTANKSMQGAGVPTNGAMVAQRKQEKADQLKAMQFKLDNLQATAGKAKNPDAVRTQIEVLKQKMDLKRQEMNAVK